MQCKKCSTGIDTIAKICPNCNEPIKQNEAEPKIKKTMIKHYIIANGVLILVFNPAYFFLMKNLLLDPWGDIFYSFAGFISLLIIGLIVNIRLCIKKQSTVFLLLLAMMISVFIFLKLTSVMLNFPNYTGIISNFPDSLFSDIWSKYEDLSNIPGELLIVNSDSDGKGSMNGLLVNNFAEGTKTELFNQFQLAWPSYNKTKDKILSLNSETNEIYELDVNSGEHKTLVKDNQSNAVYTFVKYKPNNENIISYKIGDRLYITHTLTDTQTLITNMGGGYSWSNDGEHFLFSENGKIIKYSIETNSAEELFKGVYPEYSHDNNYIAFFAGGYIIVRNVKTGEGLYYKASGSETFKFSPDDNYLAIRQGTASIKWPYGTKMICWDFRKNQVVTLIEHMSSSRYNDFDWR